MIYHIDSFSLYMTEREKLIEQLKTAVGEERARILAKLVVLDEEMESQEAEKSA